MLRWFLVLLAATVVGAIVVAAALGGSGNRSLSAATRPKPPHYVVEFLPNPDGDDPLRPNGINEKGEITGWVGWPYAAFVSGDAGTVLLPSRPGTSFGFGHEINDRGDVAGSSGFEQIDPPERATRWHDGVPKDLGTLGTDSFGHSINNLGHVVGWSYVDGQPHGFFWSPAAGMVDVNPELSFTHSYDVNERDVVTGGGGNGHAFRWQDGTYTDLGVPPGYATSVGMAINRATRSQAT